MLWTEYEKLAPEEQNRFLGKGIPFDRIRRVTGYLNQDSRQWNDGKQDELRMRLTHNLDLLDHQDHDSKTI